MQTELGLGSAQFGVKYGITNAGEKTGQDEVAKILRCASSRGITWLDTAQGYGDAEEVLGMATAEGYNFKTVTKKSPNNRGAIGSLTDTWEKDLLNSLKLLGVEQLYGFLVHEVREFNSEYGQELRHWLASTVERGLVRKVGVSIYNDKDLEGIEDEFTGIIQLPLSIYDQRALRSERISKAKKNGSEIHARSIFLQGLLLVSETEWPGWMPAEVKRHHQTLIGRCRDRGTCLRDTCVEFIRAIAFADVAIVGICSELQLKELVKSWEKNSEWGIEELRGFAIDNDNVLDPRQW